MGMVQNPLGAFAQSPYERKDAMRLLAVGVAATSSLVVAAEEAACPEECRVFFS